MPWHEQLLAFLAFTVAASAFCWAVFFPHKQQSIAAIDNLRSILKLYGRRWRGARR